MSMTTETSNARDVHTCSYACERPECIRAQRDELAARAEAQAQGGEGLNMGMLVRDGTWVGTYAEWCRRNQIAPPSAPVGVEVAALIANMAAYLRAEGGENAAPLIAHADRILAQQPAAVDSHCSDERPCTPCYSNSGPCEDKPASPPSTRSRRRDRRD